MLSGTAVSEKIPQQEQQPGPSQSNDLAGSSIDESSDEEEDGTTCKICKISWIELAEKCGDWVQCDTCNEYIFQECYDKRDISADDKFLLQYLRRIINIKVRFPINCPPGRLIMQ